MTRGGPVVAVALAVRFLLELALLAAWGWGGWKLGGGGALGTASAAAAAVAAAAIWGRWVAPRAKRRLAVGPRIALEATVFALAVAAIAVWGSPVLGIALGVAYVIDAALVYGLRGFALDDLLRQL